MPVQKQYPHVILFTISRFLIFKSATDPISIENSLSAEIRQVTDFRGLKSDRWQISVMEIGSLNGSLASKKYFIVHAPQIFIFYFVFSCFFFLFLSPLSHSFFSFRPFFNLSKKKLFWCAKILFLLPPKNTWPILQTFSSSGNDNKLDRLLLTSF